MNLKSQQLSSNLRLELDYDQTLSPHEIKKILVDALGKNNCSEQTIAGKKVLIYTNSVGIKQVLLYANISYLGGNGAHPIFKKRMQLQKSFKNVALECAQSQNYNVRFLGVYHYCDNIVFVDFVKDTYVERKMNNSAAHVYVNDLYQGMKNGVFKKVDKNNNVLYAVRHSKIKDYLDDNLCGHNIISQLFDLFAEFNHGFPFGQWLKAIKCVDEMRENQWSQWAQAEWAGWYLEYKFYNFIHDKQSQKCCEYIRHKGRHDLDFDLWFNELTFYGDLKSESLSSTAILGNDKESVLKAISTYDRFWYIVYEHDTIKDKDKTYQASEFINNLKYRSGKWPKDKPYDPHSYGEKLKNSVYYVKMYIIELNSINFGEALCDFNQGKQPNGDPRKQKVAIPKKILDNFIIYRYEYEGRE